jgi:transcriptional regulator with XRE-family HTH domain
MPEQLTRAVSKVLRRLAEERGVSGNQLAKQTGIPQPTMARKLRGASVVDLDDIEAICKVLGVTPGYVMGLAEVSHSIEEVVASD